MKTMNTKTRAEMVIGSRIWNTKTGLVFYVSETPGRGGVPDWGYTKDPAKAIDLNPYWRKRFAAYCRRVGSVARFH